MPHQLFLLLPLLDQSHFHIHLVLQEAKEKRKKKVFDISTNSYIDYIYPAFKVSLLEYNESLKIIKSSPMQNSMKT